MCPDSALRTSSRQLGVRYLGGSSVLGGGIKGSVFIVDYQAGTANVLQTLVLSDNGDCCSQPTIRSTPTLRL